MTTNNYNPATSLDAYFGDRSNRTMFRVWTREKLVHALADLGGIEFFEGPGSNPTVLAGYSASKLWLRVEPGVTSSPGTVRYFDGGDPALLASWPLLDRTGFASHIGLAFVTGLLGLAYMGPPQGRLTLTPGVAVTTADIAGAQTIYYTPTTGRYVPIYNGTSWAMMDFAAELSLVLTGNSGHVGYHQSGKNFDLFIINDGGAPRLASGPAWTSNIARGTGAGTTELERKDGLWLNKQSITLRFGQASGNTVSVAAQRATYVGTFRATANGQATDGERDRLLFNAYNQAPRRLFVAEVAAGGWNYSIAAFRPANNNLDNRVTVLIGLPGGTTKLHTKQTGHGSAGGQTMAGGIGYDITNNALDDFPLAASTGANYFLILSSDKEHYTDLGFHTYTLLEFGANTGTQSWYGDGVYAVLSGEVAY